MKHLYTFFLILLITVFATPVVSFALVSYPPGALLQVGDVTTSHIRDNTITNADISPTAAISATKVAGGSNSGLVMLSTAGGLATSTTLSFATTTNTLNVTGELLVTATTTLNGVGYSWPDADGSSAQVLQTDGAGQLSWVDSGRTLLYATTTDVTVSNTAATTTLISFTVPGNTLSTGNVIRGRLNLNGGTYGFSLYGGVTMTVKVLYGGSEVAVAHLTPSGNFENLTVGNYGAIEFNIVGRGTTGTQEGYVDISAARYDTPTVLHSAGVGSAAIDSTADKTLSVVVKYSSAGVNNSINLTNAYVEIAR